MDINKLASKVRKALVDYDMIKNGDKVAVGLSGGKDSVTLLAVLNELKKYLPQKFDLVAITVDLAFKDNPTDYSPLEIYCRDNGIPFYLVKTQIGEIVFDVRKESNPCSLCSRMRKGALYGKAAELGVTKVALGHHSDDLIDTFLLSMFYEGRLSTFPPKSKLEKTGITVIRPMLYVKECDVSSFAKSGIPIVKSKCPANKNTKREEVKILLDGIKKSVPNVKSMIFTAITHPDRYNLFDKFKSEITAKQPDKEDSL